MPVPRLIRALLLAAAAWLPCAAAAGAQEPAKRYSLAISGGASMGAYEAGLNWGILHFLRRYGQTDPVLGGDNRPLTLTSVAGASAGGINSIHSGLVWCAREMRESGLVNRLDDNLFRDVWLSIDINDLLPLRPDSPRYPVFVKIVVANFMQPVSRIASFLATPDGLGSARPHRPASSSAWHRSSVPDAACGRPRTLPHGVPESPCPVPRAAHSV